MKLITTLLLIVAPALLSQLEKAVPHEVYVSLAQIEYNSESNALEVALKLFTDDTDRALGRYFRENLRLGEPDEHPQSDSLLTVYLQQKLIFTCNGQPLNLRFYGKEVSVEETWCYFDFPLECESDKELKVESRIFTEVFADQVNLMKFSGGNMEEQSLQLNKDLTTGIIQLP